MAIYGTALLAFCLVCGVGAGRLIGLALGIDANVGGVGIAMLLLIALSPRIKPDSPTAGGIKFWASIYIPIVVAMAASQNVRAAVSGGPAALLAGLLTVIVCFALVPILSGSPESGEAAAAGEGEA